MRRRNALLAALLFASADASAAQNVAPDGSKARIPFAERADAVGIRALIANSPQIYDAYLVYVQALRYAGTTPRPDKELMILRTTQLRKGDYEFQGHKRLATTCGWLTNEQAENLGNWRKSTLFTDRQRALLGFADQMLTKGTVDDKTFEPMSKLFTTQEIVELSLTSAFYSGLVQFSTALELEAPASTAATDAMLKAHGCELK
jgi:alkylhydroperoxidase family enzyme